MTNTGTGDKSPNLALICPHASKSKKQKGVQPDTPLSATPVVSLYAHPLKKKNKVLHGSGPEPRVGSGDIKKIPRVESGRVKRCWKSHRSSRVGSRGAGNPAGRVGSGQEVLEIPRVESGRVKRCWKSHGSSRVRSRGVGNPTGRVGSVPEVFIYIYIVYYDSFFRGRGFGQEFLRPGLNMGFSNLDFSPSNRFV